MNTAYLLIGGNLGDRAAYLAEAVKQISVVCGRVTSISSLYETAAWGNTNQPHFLNQAILLKTPFTPQMVLQKCLAIEKQLGRHREIKWGPRSIDIDILLYNNAQITAHNLQIPHPFLQERRFVLQPLCEIIPNYHHPILHKTLQQLLVNCPDTLPVNRYLPR
jgi:2-amino-4-hydroxy-6-hydroxymethyldihydropteridine diphosphokinase